jgi:hypothetical protein
MERDFVSSVMKSPGGILHQLNKYHGCKAHTYHGINSSLGFSCKIRTKLKNQTPWPESASELYRPSDRRLSAKSAPTFSDMGCYVVSVTDLYGNILRFLDRSHYFFFQVAPQLYSRG